MNKEALLMKLKAFLWSNKIYFCALWKCSKLYLLCRLMVIAAMNFSLIFNLFFLKVFVDAIIEKNNFQLAINFLILNFIVRFSTDQIISWIRVYLKHVHLIVQVKMQQMVVERSFAFDLEVFEKPDFYDTFTRAYEYASTNSEGIISTISGIVSDLIGLSAVVYIIARLNIFVIIVLMTIVILDLAINMRRDSIMDKLKRRLTRIYRKQGYITTLLNNKSAFKDLKINNAKEYIMKKMQTVLLICKKGIMSVEVRTNLLKIPVRLMEAIFVVVIYYFIGKDLFLGAITVGDFNMTYNAAYSIKAYLITIGAGISELRKMSINATYFYEFFTFERENNGTKKLINDDEISIEFKNVYFKYIETQDWVLRDVSFKINPGETTLFIGENGAGKSTIVNLLLRLYRPSSGNVLVNGIPLEDYDIKELYEVLSVVFQDHKEYAFSIAENILLKEEDEIRLSNEEGIVGEALDFIHLNKILELPMGIFTSLTRELDDQGVDLSGGEKQKLAIARAFVKRAKLFVLDEPSSSLDPISEENIYEALKNITHGCTTIIISHHLSNSIYADQIIVMDKGNVVETGDHRHLLENGGIYAKLYNMQRKKYIQQNEQKAD